MSGSRCGILSFAAAIIADTLIERTSAVTRSLWRQLVDVALLGIVSGTSINGLRLKAWSWTLVNCVQVGVCVFAVATLVLTIWATLRQLWSIASFFHSHDEDEDDHPSRLPMLLAGCLVGNIGLWIWSAVGGNAALICDGLGLSASVCDNKISKILFNIIFITSGLAQLVVLGMIGIGSFKFKLPSFGRGEKSGKKTRRKLRSSSPTQPSHASVSASAPPFASHGASDKKCSSEPILGSPSMHDSHYAPGEHPLEIGHNPALAEDELELEEKIKRVPRAFRIFPRMSLADEALDIPPLCTRNVLGSKGDEEC
ncbi:hypothetical protein JCM3766R1_005200 [Sporobolomyces carnicolor]